MNLKDIHRFVQHHKIKGFLPESDAEAIYALACEAEGIGPCLEIGSYCGLSSVYLGEACRATGNILFSVDHHRGSEEHQPGEAYHDPDHYDAALGKIDTLPAFRRTLALANLDDHVIPIVANSTLAVTHWQTPLGFVFVDGGHSFEAALHDCVAWGRKLAPGGRMAVHDLFETPEEGGQAPLRAYREATETLGLIEVARIGSLGVLERSSHAH